MTGEQRPLGCVVTRHRERTREQRGVVRAAERVIREGVKR